jgi:hypothetical protein
LSDQPSFKQLFHLSLNLILVMWRIFVGSRVHRCGTRDQWNSVIMNSTWWQGLKIIENILVLEEHFSTEGGTGAGGSRSTCFKIA